MNKSLATVENAIRFKVADCDPQFITALRQHFTRSNPAFEKAVNRGDYIKSVDRFLRLYRMTADGCIEVPRGAVAAVRQVADRCGVDLLWSPETRSYKRPKVPLNDLPLRLRDYQHVAVERMASGVQGYIKAPCGAGKTVIGASAIIHVDQPAIVFVHTTDLLDQWVSLLRGWDYRVRAIYAGRYKDLERPLSSAPGNPEIAVAMVQTVHKNLGRAEPMLSSAGVILVDEAHHSPASTFREVIEHCPALRQQE